MLPLLQPVTACVLFIGALQTQAGRMPNVVTLLGEVGLN